MKNRAIVRAFKNAERRTLQDEPEELRGFLDHLSETILPRLVRCNCPECNLLLFKNIKSNDQAFE